MQKIRIAINRLSEATKEVATKLYSKLRPIFSKFWKDVGLFATSFKEKSTNMLWNVLSAYLTLWPEKQPYKSTMGRIYIQDFPTAVMPIRRESAPNFRIRLSPENAEFEQILIHALSDRDRDRRDLTDAVSDFIEDLTCRLFACGDVSYRIIASPVWCEAQPKYKNFELDLMTGSTFNWGLCYVYCVNRKFSDQVYLRGLSPSPIFLHKKEVFSFVLPREILTQREHRKLIKTLIASSGLQPRFVRENMSEYFAKFNYSEYHRASTVEMMRTLKNVGASINFVPDLFSSEYYRFDMFIKFYGTIAVLRESIIDQLNDLLKRLGIEYSLKIEGLPLPQHATEARKKLFEGIYDFRAASDLVQTP